jgi:predicted GNAT superfamily acetyltransferase
MFGIAVRPLHSIDDFRRCVEITREVWADSELETEPYVTFVIADHTGGQVLGAFDGDALVGFTKAFVGLHERTPYLHSHMLAVLSSHRDRGIGRQLKLAQREDALRRDIRLIEWTFDPLETKNAHFNINRLGAISRRYIPDFYGITTSPLHRGLATDRLLVEWHLESPRVIAAINDLIAEPHDCDSRVHLPSVHSLASVSSQPSDAASHVVSAVQARSSTTEAANLTSAELLALQSRLRSAFTDWFAKGYAVTAVRLTSSGVDYCLSPYSDF